MPKRRRDEAEALAKLVVHYYENAGERSSSATCKHFKEAGVATSTVRDILRRFETENRITHKKPSGRKPTVSTPKVWQALDENGNVSDPFISTGTIDAKTYKEECVEKRLVPFIERHHDKTEVLFWPDMATSHYAGIVRESLASHGITFVEKVENAPNVPQARPIERFWSLCKAEYGHRKVGAKSLRSFSKIWRNISKKVAQRSGTVLMRSARRNVRKIAYEGVHAPLRKD
jgi:transposase